MAHEGFGAHTEDMELEHLELPYFGNYGREPSLDLDKGTSNERLKTAGVHMNLPSKLSFALGFTNSTIVNSK